MITLSFDFGIEQEGQKNYGEAKNSHILGYHLSIFGNLCGALDNIVREGIHNDSLQFEMDFASEPEPKPLSIQDSGNPEVKKEEQPSLFENTTILTPQQHENGF